MSLLEQPEEILRIQLEQLDAISLLKACSSDPAITRICRDDYFWINKLQAEFPDIPLPTDITQARRFYLSITLFNGEIYRNGELKHVGLMLYDDVYQFANAEDVLFYSVPSWDKENVGAPFDLDILGASWAYNGHYLTNIRPSQIDIIPINDVVNRLERHANMLWVLNYKENLSAFEQGQQINFPTVDLFGVTGTQSMRRADIIDFSNHSSGGIVYLLREKHESANSPVYKRYTEDMYQRTLINLRSPNIQILHPIADIQQRKLLVLQRLEDSWTKLLDYEGDIQDASGYPTYDKFIEAQSVAVNALTDEQLTALEHTLQVLNGANITSWNIDKDRTLDAIFFSTFGQLTMHVD